ncbi:MAG TPA: ATPase domain-containing protein, partial [Roseiflexaceae bacterium]
MPQHERDTPSRADDLSALIAAIQRRWGDHAIQRGVEREAPALLPTGIAALDELLGGGYPRGAITELLGAPTSGTTTIALTALAQAQVCGEGCAYIDLGGHFGAEYAAACGVDLAALALVRPASAIDALAIVEALVTHHVGVVIIHTLDVLDAARARQDLAGGLRRLARALPASPSVLLVVTALPNAVAHDGGTRHSMLGSLAALRLGIVRDGWQLADPRSPVCHARVTVLRRRRAAAGGAC